MTLAQAGAPAQTPDAGPANAAAARPETRASRVHAALSAAIDSYRKGEYEMAVGFFKQAQAGQNELTASERQDLTNWMQLNNAALQARRDGGDKLRQAEQYIKAGRSQEANELLKAVTVNQQYLTAADKQKCQTLVEQIRPAMPAVNPQAGTATGQQLARTKLQQARVFLAKGNYDAAESLAREAEQLKATYAANEDTPKKVYDDISKARGIVVTDGDPKSYVAAARQALDRGDLEIAEHLAKEAEKSSSSWSSLRLWGDSPAKVLRDVQAARARQSGTKPAVVSGDSKTTFGAMKTAFAKGDDKQKTVVEATVSNKPTETPKTPPSTEQARQLVKQAREAMQAGDYGKAREYASQAKSLKAEMTWWDDTPDKVLADLQRVEGVKPAGAVQGAAQGTMPAKPSKSDPGDPQLMLKQARDLYHAGKYDDAEKMAYKAKSVKGAHWGLFDDSPDAVIKDIGKARAKHDQEESVRVLAEARKMYEKANGDLKSLDEAERLAYRAEKLHGPYGVLDLGDKPSKLRAEIETARTKARKIKVPPVPSMDVAKKDKPVSQAVPLASKASTPAPEVSHETKRVDSAVAQVSATQPVMPPTPPPVQPPPVQPPPVMPVPTVQTANPAKEQAQRLVAEARQCQKDGRLVEARQKAMEAQKLNVTFAADEDRPEMVLLAVSATCEKQIETLVQQASEMGAAAATDPAKCQKAENCLAQAKQLAETFGFDAQPIQAKMVWLHEQRQPTAPMPAPALPAVPVMPAPGAHVAQAQPAQPTMPEPVPTAQPQTARGEALLEQARMELRKGETTTARRLAEEAFTGPYGVQGGAEKLLRSIDAEEFNQKVLANNRAFDAGVAAYQRKDYAQASTILRGLDRQLLQPDKQGRLKELMLTPELQPHIVQTASKTPGAAVPPPANTGIAQASDLPPSKPEPTYAQQVQAMQEVKLQQLRTENLRVLREAQQKFVAGETDKALEMLQDYLGTLRDSGIEPEKVAQLKTPVESKLQQFKTLKSQKDFEKLIASQHDSAQQMQARLVLNEENKKKQVKELMAQYNALFKEGKYKEAEAYAARAHELDPDNPIPGAAMYTARMQTNVTEANKGKKSREDAFLNQLDDAENAGPSVNSDHPLFIDPKVVARNRDRKPTEVIGLGSKSDKVRQIESKLQAPISLDFKETSLRQVLDDLRDWTGINIVPDEPALLEENIKLDSPISMKLEQVSLKSALNLVLHQVHLTYVVKDEVLQVTTEAHARGKLVVQNYNVADLVIPVQNAVVGGPSLLQQAVDQGQVNTMRTNNVAPWLSPNSLPGGSNVGGSSAPNGQPTPQVTKQAPSQTMEDLLIKLITNTIAPQSWASMGGPGTIEYYPLGLALVINQTPDIQEQIADLLAALRRLQDQEVSVELRFITVAESFYERIGLDFNINLKTDKWTTKYQPQIVSQQFQPFGYVNDFNPKDLLIGLTPAGTFTQDLSIPVKNSSFAMAVPPFGGFPNIPGGNGGIDLGLAFLSDIQVYMFMEAAQGDQRTNVMQAPKITLFNGQTSTISVSDQQFFVVSVQVLQQGGQVVFVPSNIPVQTGGVTLTLQAVISADRRFVRLNLVPTITNLASAIVPLFPITTFITPVFEGGAVGQPIPFTQFIQQPVFNTISVQTTVMMPDGGTVLLGGLKRMSEGRNEFGPPILSKIPYINRLFKNVGYGRESESLLLMVTPRIIINAEEEVRQTGVTVGEEGVQIR
jgi:type II secretory pathway component GspD/PulD (secretin)/tetratricopeptide (TPR) repeat protein